MFLRWLLGQLACKQHTRFFLSFGISSQLDTTLYISQPMLAWMWTCPTWTWPPCSSIKTTSSLEQWLAGCRYTHPHIFLVKVGLLKLLRVVGGLRAQINHGKVFPTWSTSRISLCWIWSGQTSSQSYASSLGQSSWVTCCGQRGGQPCGCTNETWWSEWISIVKPRRSCVAAGARLWCRTYGHWLQGHTLTGSAFECCSLGIGLKNACKNLIPKMCFLAASHMAPFFHTP